MTKTYAQIVQQIETLKEAAEKARRKEIDGVIARIRHAIEVYDLTAADLGLARTNGAADGSAGGSAKPARKRRGARKGAAKAVRAVKFSNGAGGTWGGRGKRPQWLRDALAGGKTLDEFLVK